MMPQLHLFPNILGGAGGQTAPRGQPQAHAHPACPLTLSLSPQGRGKRPRMTPQRPAATRATPPLPWGERAGVRGPR